MADMGFWSGRERCGLKSSNQQELDECVRGSVKEGNVRNKDHRAQQKTWTLATERE